MAEYSQKLKDMDQRTVSLSGNMATFSNELEKQSHWYIYLPALIADAANATANYVAAALSLAGLLKQGFIAAPISYGADKAEEFVSNLNKQVTAATDKTDALKKAQASLHIEVVKVQAELAKMQEGDANYKRTKPALELLLQNERSIGNQLSIIADKKKSDAQAAHDAAVKNAAEVAVKNTETAKLVANAEIDAASGAAIEKLKLQKTQSDTEFAAVGQSHANIDAKADYDKKYYSNLEKMEEDAATKKLFVGYANAEEERKEKINGAHGNQLEIDRINADINAKETKLSIDTDAKIRTLRSNSHEEEAKAEEERVARHHALTEQMAADEGRTERKL